MVVLLPLIIIIHFTGLYTVGCGSMLASCTSGIVICGHSGNDGLGSLNNPTKLKPPQFV